MQYPKRGTLKVQLLFFVGRSIKNPEWAKAYLPRTSNKVVGEPLLNHSKQAINKMKENATMPTDRISILVVNLHHQKPATIYMSLNHFKATIKETKPNTRVVTNRTCILATIFHHTAAAMTIE